MKLTLLSSSILTAFVALPDPAIASASPEQFSWEGFYAGVTGGYGNLDNKGSYYKEQCIPGTISVVPNVTNTTFSVDPSLNTVTITNVIEGTTSTIPGAVISDYIDFNPSDESWFLGGEIGYNRQVGDIVLGGILDFSGTNYTTHYAHAMNNVSVATDLKWFSTVRLRAGIPIDRFLVYGTAGVAIGHFNVAASDTMRFWSESYTEPGWTAGAGVAYAFSERWVADVSYLHLDFNSVSHPLGIATVRTDIAADVVKIGLNYKF